MLSMFQISGTAVRARTSRTAVLVQARTCTTVEPYPGFTSYGCILPHGPAMSSWGHSWGTASKSPLLVATMPTESDAGTSDASPGPGWSHRQARFFGVSVHDAYRTIARDHLHGVLICLR